MAQSCSNRDFKTGEEQVFEARVGGKEDLGPGIQNVICCDSEGKLSDAHSQTNLSLQRS